jgi:hypothetical protein
MTVMSNGLVTYAKGAREADGMIIIDLALICSSGAKLFACQYCFPMNFSGTALRRTANKSHDQNSIVFKTEQPVSF